MDNNVWRVGAYLRLSVDDGDDKIESNSITNQRKLINQYCKSKDDLAILNYYEDDGFTGTDFNRPGFKELLSDIKENNINCVIVKDLSRFGRNYIEVGNYLEQVFPAYGIRFIAIGDNIDSYKDPNSLNNMVVPFKNLMNDEYARDISNKVKSVFRSKIANDELCGGGQPYGYIRGKNIEGKSRFIVDPEPAEIVRKIFDYALEGYSKQQIADILNEMCVDSPSYYREITLRKKQGKKINSFKSKNKWYESSINRILRNEVYVGDMIQNKTKRINYKLHDAIKQPRSEWSILKDAHEPIISREKFQLVQDIVLNRDNRKTKHGSMLLFSGHLRCSDCHQSLISYTSKVQDGTDDMKRYYCCRGYRRKKSNCSSHSISEDELKELVLKAINTQINLMIDINTIITQSLNDKKSIIDNKIMKKNISECQNEIKNISKLKLNVYSDYKSGLLSESDYFEFKNVYENKISELQRKIETLEKQIEDSNKIIDEITNGAKWIKEFTKRKGLKELNRNVINELIDWIYVTEDKNIEIKFKYQDKFNLLANNLSYFKNDK